MLKAIHKPAHFFMLCLACFTAFVGSGLSAQAQMQLPPPGPLDPARTAQLRAPAASHLIEQFIWTANDAAARDPQYQASVRGQDDKTEPHYFRSHFQLAQVPPEATFYIAGPRSATVYLNGHEVLRFADDPTRPKNLSVLTADLSAALQAGDNVIALEEVRGHSSLHTGASPTINQITYGEVLAVKIVPSAIAVNAPPILISDKHWRSAVTPIPGGPFIAQPHRAMSGEQQNPAWSQPAFDDSNWPQVQSLGVLGSKSDFLQWNADAGLYAWPGYTGISDSLRVFDIFPPTVLGAGNGITLDFRREISGRLHITSNASSPIEVTISYGESREEASNSKGYLGARKLTIPAHGTAFGPKSGFRYAVVRYPFGANADQLDFSAEAITYPVQYRGSFESSDPLLNRIWDTAAYTARLCMQEGIWDGVKRDRGRWMGDLDVTGRTITAVFGDTTTNELMERTMADIIGDPPVTREINTIAGYSALWITGQADFYRHTGDMAYLRTMQPRLLDLLKVMGSDLDKNALFNNPGKHKVFIDWSNGFTTDTPEARAATHFEFMMAFKEAAYLLDELGDHDSANRCRQQLAAMLASAQSSLLSADTNTFGTRLQTNSLAVLSNAANPSAQDAVWSLVLAHVGERDAVITPYQGYYTLSAMAQLHHRAEALAWMRTYWGGMLAEGATSFWEAYDPHWPKQDFHASLQADNKQGYYVSLAHGWASGPAAWLIEQVLGIQPSAAGFREVTIRPDLAGLQWARGSEPTPRGLIHVDIKPQTIVVTLPPETKAKLELPFANEAVNIRLNGKALPSNTPRIDKRLQVTLDRPGIYTFTAP